MSEWELDGHTIERDSEGLFLTCCSHCLDSDGIPTCNLAWEQQYITLEEMYKGKEPIPDDPFPPRPIEWYYCGATDYWGEYDYEIGWRFHE